MEEDLFANYCQFLKDVYDQINGYRKVKRLMTLACCLEK